MAQYEHLSIYKECFDLKVYVENIVRGFSRYNKYTLGSELRNITMEILVLIVMANSQNKKREILLNIRYKLEELKILARVCKQVKAYKNFNSFETFVKHIVQISRQNEGWLKSQNPS